MLYEVENKFPIADPDRAIRAMSRLGAEFRLPVEQCDAYFAHPARDFATTDEALRIRRSGGVAWITYKGPKIDATTKTRRELDLPLAAGTAEGFAELLAALGFRPVAEVRKLRTPGTLLWREQAVTVAVDRVEGLGTFVELEIAADEAQLDRARDCLGDLATALSLGPPERRGYLDLLLRPPNEHR